jgi:hypothetical protein
MYECMNYVQIRFSREKFEPGPGFEPRISSSNYKVRFHLIIIDLNYVHMNER